MIDLEAIRKRDAACFIAADQRAPIEWRDRRALLAYVDALREAAGKVSCFWCHGVGADTEDGPCPDCADLRALINNNKD